MSDVILLPGKKLKGAYVHGQVVVEKTSAAIVTDVMAGHPEIQTAVSLELLEKQDFDPAKVRMQREGKVTASFYGERAIGWNRYDAFEKKKVEKKKRGWGEPAF